VCGQDKSVARWTAQIAGVAVARRHYDMIYLLTAIGLTTGGCRTVHIYTETTHRTTQWNRIPRTEHT